MTIFCINIDLTKLYHYGLAIKSQSKSEDEDCRVADFAYAYHLGGQASYNNNWSSSRNNRGSSRYNRSSSWYNRGSSCLNC